MAYFPNSTAGDVLDQQCENCPLGYGWNDPKQGKLFDDERPPKPCPVALVQLEYNYRQLDKGNELLRQAMTILIDDKGICQTRKLLVECRREEATP